MLLTSLLLALCFLPPSRQLPSNISDASLQAHLTYSEIMFETMLGWFNVEEEMASTNMFLKNNLTSLKEAVTMRLFGSGSWMEENMVS